MLFGRDSELSALAELAARARNGAGSALVVIGEPGVGKTALCREAAAHATGVRLLEATGVESEAEVPFAGLSELLRPVLDRRDELPEAQAAALDAALSLGPPAGGERFAVYAATLTLLALAAAEKPILAVVDDAQWLDPASAEAIRFAGRRLASDPVALLITLREGEGGAAAFSELPELRLGGLADDEGCAMLDRLTQGRIADSVARHLVEATAGNALALSELATELGEDQLTGVAALPEPLPVGPALRATYERRMADLPEAVRASLLVAAAAGTREMASIGAGIVALGHDPADLEPAERAGFVVLHEGRVSFRHPVIRSAIYHLSQPHERRAAHAALAVALADDPVSRAWHLGAAATGPDEEVATTLVDAGRAARRRGGPATAARLLERSARLTQEPDERARRLFRAARSAQLGASNRWAMALLDEASRDATDPALRTEIVHAHAVLEQFSGSIPRARDLMLAEADRVESRDPERAAALLLDAALTSVMEGDLRAALAAGERACKCLDGSADTFRDLAGAARETIRLLRAEEPQGPGLGALLDSLMSATDLPRGSPFAIQLGLAELTYTDRFATAGRILDELIEGFRAASAVALLPFALGNRAELQLRTGRWSGAAADASEAIALSAEVRQGIIESWCLGVVARQEAARGETDACRNHAADAVSIATRLESGSGEVQGLATLGFLELGLGEVDLAIDSLEEVRRRVHVHEMLHPAVVPWAGDLIEAYARAGREDDARRELGVLEERSAHTASGWGQATATRCRGVLATGADADDAFAEALRRHEQLGAPFESARTELCLGEALRRRRRRTESREHLERALGTFEQLGAEPWIRRARDELGASVRTAVRRSVTPANERLTPRELQIALAVADGATNKEAAAKLFVSPKTISAHLGSVYRKLGIRRRSELARIVHEGKLLPASSEIDA